jgi:hypothetical protein
MSQFLFQTPMKIIQDLNNLHGDPELFTLLLTYTFHILLNNYFSTIYLHCNAQKLTVLLILVCERTLDKKIQVCVL